jgi:hypothetical protein
MLLLDEVGVYELPGKSLAVNMFDERESNLIGSSLADEESNASATKELAYRPETIRKARDIDIYFIMGAMFFVLLELYYLRWRGEL